MQTLTKPQADFLFRVMLEPRTADGSALRVARNLERIELVELVPPMAYRATRLGLEALCYYWMLKDAASGCIAYMKHREEVEAALASRFPEPLKLAA
jgi:hypothetical protein